MRKNIKLHTCMKIKRKITKYRNYMKIIILKLIGFIHQHLIEINNIVNTFITRSINTKYFHLLIIFEFIYFVNKLQFL